VNRESSCLRVGECARLKVGSWRPTFQHTSFCLHLSAPRLTHKLQRMSAAKRTADAAGITSPAAPHAKFLRGQQSTASTVAGSSAPPRAKSGGQQQHAACTDRPAIGQRGEEEENKTHVRTGIKAPARPSNAPGASRGIGFFNRAQLMLLKEVMSCVD
jgi:hypothetical protein